MPEPRTPPLAVLYGALSPRTRMLVAASGVLSLAARLGFVAAAALVGRGDAPAATAVAVASGAVFALRRVVDGSARVGAEVELLEAGARATLEGDVLALGGGKAHRAVFEAGYEARVLVSATLPELVASVVASLAVVPVLVDALPSRLLFAAGTALAVILVGVALVRRDNARWQVRVLAAQQRVSDLLAGAVEGRLDLVASGRDQSFLATLGSATEAYRTTSRRASWASAMLGRAPIAAGALVVALFAVLDPASRDALASAVLGRALLLAACVPVFLSAVLGANELVRASARVVPLVELLTSPKRAELSRTDGRAPELPAIVAAKDVSFSYKADGPEALRRISLAWSPGVPLVLEGRNGAGKSTLLRLLLGLRAPDEGVMQLGERDLASLDLAALRRRVAYLPQRPYLGEAHTTVRAAVHLLEPDVGDEAIESSLERVELLSALRGRGPAPLEVPVGELSAGQKQRLALARVLLRDAKLVLLDEPDANLDHAGVVMLTEIVRDLSARGVMVAIAAHTPELTLASPLRVSLS